LRRIVPVRHGASRRPALIYLAPERGGGGAGPGDQELVVGSARDWKLPDEYVGTLARGVPGFRGTLRVAAGGRGGAMAVVTWVRAGVCRPSAFACSSKTRRR